MPETETAPAFADFYPETAPRRVMHPVGEAPVTYIEDDGRYAVDGMAGVVFYLVGRSQRWEPDTFLVLDPETGEEYEETDGEGEWTDDPEGQLWACMVGDDRLHPVDPEDLTELADDDYCGGCGQVGCTADGR